LPQSISAVLNEGGVMEAIIGRDILRFGFRPIGAYTPVVYPPVVYPLGVKNPCDDNLRLTPHIKSLSPHIDKRVEKEPLPTVDRPRYHLCNSPKCQI